MVALFKIAIMKKLLLALTLVSICLLSCSKNESFECTSSGLHQGQPQLPQVKIFQSENEANSFCDDFCNGLNTDLCLCECIRKE